MWEKAVRSPLCYHQHWEHKQPAETANRRRNCGVTRGRREGSHFSLLPHTWGAVTPLWLFFWQMFWFHDAQRRMNTNQRSWRAGTHARTYKIYSTASGACSDPSSRILILSLVRMWFYFVFFPHWQNMLSEVKCYTYEHHRASFFQTGVSLFSSFLTLTTYCFLKVMILYSEKKTEKKTISIYFIPK